MCNHKFEITAIIKDRKGRVLSIGKNSYIKTHPMMIKLANKIGEFNSKRPFIHAEIDAINKCRKLDKAHSIEVYRYSETLQRYVSSKPCEICHSGLTKTPIKYMSYVDKEGLRVIEKIKH